MAGSSARNAITLHPRRSGTQQIPPILVEFVDRRAGQRATPKDEDAYELLSDRLEFSVLSMLEGATDLPLAPPREALDPLAHDEGNHPQLGLGPRSTGRCPGRNDRVVLAASPLEKRNERPTNWPARDSTAWCSGPPPRESEMEPYFVELSSIVRDYLENQFDLRGARVDDGRVFGAIQ